MATSVATTYYPSVLQYLLKAIFFLSNKTVFLGRQGTVAEELWRTLSMFALDFFAISPLHEHDVSTSTLRSPQHRNMCLAEKDSLVLDPSSNSRLWDPDGRPGSVQLS